MNDTVGYARYELLRTFRNKRLYVFSFAFPVVLYYAIAGPNRHEHDIGGTGIAASLYFMVGLAAFGGMAAVLGSGARIAAERAVGWNRQLRLTPLSTRTYFRVKVLTAYAMALVTLALLFVAGLTLGVHLRAGNWLADDDPDADRPRAVRRARDPARPSPHGRLDRARRSVA